MSWNLEGMTVSGTYLEQFPVRGKVDLSRVKYGGRVSHHVVLDEPILVFGTMRDRVIIDHGSIVQVKG